VTALIDVERLDAPSLDWAQRLVTRHHYRRSPVPGRACPEGWAVTSVDLGRVGCLIVGRPQATLCRPWYGSLDDAGRIVSVGAVVADVQALRDRAVVQLPRDAVGLQEASAAPTFTDAAVTRGAGAGPQPAALALLDPLPEALGERHALVGPGRERAQVVVLHEAATAGDRRAASAFAGGRHGH
jgi:hypothetical protein